MDENKVKGTIWGKAVGDALGVPMEFRSKTLLAQEWPDGAPTEYQRTVRGISVWDPGDWSDDTEQALLIIESMASTGFKVRPRHIAKGFFDWLCNDGRGAGGHTTNVLTDAKFLEDPYDSSLRVWLKSKRRAAANGAVMRTAYVGLVSPWDLKKVEDNAASVACITHYDPRCVASAVAASVAVAALVEGADIPEALEEAAGRAYSYHEEAPEWVLDKSLEDLDLSEGMDDPNRVRRPPIGYTYKTLGAGMWALREWWDRRDHDDSHVDRFLSVLHLTMMEGGDVDTNAAVVGALLGAAAGFDAIPENLSAGLTHQERLQGVLDAVLNQEQS